MKRLSREERIGAVALALVTLIVLVGTLLWRHRSADKVEMPQEITVHAVADSTAGQADDDEARKEYASRKKHRKKRSGERSRNQGKRRGKNKREKHGKETNAPQYRDFLKDTIPMSGK